MALSDRGDIGADDNVGSTVTSSHNELVKSARETLKLACKEYHFWPDLIW